jgi:hypothetical protein
MGSCEVLFGVRVDEDDDRVWSFRWRDSTALELVETVCAGLAPLTAAQLANVLHANVNDDGTDSDISLRQFLVVDLQADDPLRGRALTLPGYAAAGVVVDVGANAVDFYWSAPLPSATVAPLTAELGHALRLPWSSLSAWATRARHALDEVERAAAATGFAVEDGNDISDAELRPLFERAIM